METYDLKGFRKRRWKSKSAAFQRYCSQYSRERLNDCTDVFAKQVLTLAGLDITLADQPRTHFYPEKLFDALTRYSPESKPFATDGVHLRAGIRLAKSCFKPHILKVRSLEMNEVRGSISNKSGSAGLTAIGKRKDEVLEYGRDRAKLILEGEATPRPCIAYARTAELEKVRLIWGYPLEMTVLEGLVAKPLQDWFIVGDVPVTLARNKLDILSKMNSAFNRWAKAYCLDFSRFDSTISALLIHEAFNILRSYFDADECEPVSGATVKHIFDVCEAYFIRTPIVMPDGVLYTGKIHGVPSGSFFTQMIDSIVNVILIGAISSYFHMRVKKTGLIVLGDDSVVWSNVNVPLSKIATFLKEYFGIILNEKKSVKAKMGCGVHYLGRDWRGNHAYYSERRMINHIIHPDRYRQYGKGKELVVREVTQLLASFATVGVEGLKICCDIRGIPVELCSRYLNNLEQWMYGKHHEDGNINTEALTGSARFFRKYIDADRGKPCDSWVFSYWLTC